MSTFESHLGQRQRQSACLILFYEFNCRNLIEDYAESLSGQIMNVVILPTAHVQLRNGKLQYEE